MTAPPRRSRSTSRVVLAVAAVAIMAVAYAVGYRPAGAPRSPEPATSPRQRAVVPAVQTSPRPSPAAAALREADDAGRAQPAPPARQMSHREARQLVERVVETRLERKLTADDYDRLADLVIELRNTARTLQSGDAADAGELDRQRDRLQRALDGIATITGLPPSELSGALTSE